LIGRLPQVEAINKNGLQFESLGQRQRITIAATDRIAVVADATMVLFCVKSSDTENAARAMAPHLAPEAIVLSLQNGVDNVERIRAHTKNPVLPVLVYAAAQIPAPGSVQHTGGGNLVIGSDLPREIADVLESAGVPVRISDNIDVELWTKLTMNCAYNAISALGHVPYGQMVAMPEVRDVMRDVVIEVARVGEAKGVRLPDNIVDATLKLAEAMPMTVSSTAQDMLKGKRTEIDHLNGAVVRLGDALGIATPVNRALNALIKLREQTVSSRS
jgi:2-dehydropantoate 2-reductase